MKTLTPTSTNVALAASSLLGLTGLANAEGVDGTIIYYTGQPVTASATAVESGQFIIFNLATGSVVVSSSDQTGASASFDLGASTVSDPAQADDRTYPSQNTTGILIQGSNTDNLVVDLPAGASIGNQYSIETNTAGFQGAGDSNFYLAGKNNEYLNKEGTPNSPFPTTASNTGTTASTTGYLGLTFNDPNVATQQDYGWAEITVAPAGDVTLDGFAYDDSGAAILAGEIPEPTPASMILLSGAALAFLARRNRKASAA